MKTILKTRRLSMEVLESRQMLSAWAGIELRSMGVPNRPVLPGATDVVLVKQNVRVSGDMVVFPNKMDFTATKGLLAGNAENIRLLAIYGRQEVVMGTGVTVGNTVSIVVAQPYWLSNGAQVRLVAKASQDMAGNRLAVKLTEAEFVDQNNNVVPDANIRYRGRPTTLTLLSNVARFDQAWQPETTVVYAGQQGIQLFRFNAWTQDPARPTALQSVSFTADQGSLANGASYSLLADGEVLQSGVKPRAGKVSFNLLRGKALDGGHMFTVNCDGASALASDPRLALEFSSLRVRELRTGKLLRGTAFNDGAGQVRVATRQSPVFVFQNTTASGLYVSEVETLPQEWFSAGAQNVVVNTANVFTEDHGVSMTQVIVSAQVGSLRNAENWALWAWENNRSHIIAVGEFVGNDVVFDFVHHVDAGMSFKMEVHADIVSSANLVTPTMQTKLLSVSAVFDRFAVDQVYLSNADQPIMNLG